MKDVVRQAEILLAGSDSISYQWRVDQAVIDTYKMLQSGMIRVEEATTVFKRLMGLSCQH